MNFTYNLPVNLLFGIGKSNEIGKEVKKYGNKVLIVTGKNSTKKSGLLYKVIDLLNSESISYEIFDKIMQNPLSSIVEEGAKLVIKSECNVVLGLGGGSIMDAAKSIAFCAKNLGNIEDYIFGVKKGNEALPIVLVPTTCGTGSEGNSFSVITNSKTKDKKSLRDNLIIAKSSIIDPELMMTMPKSILASVGFDALAHNMEAYLSKITNPLVEIQAIYGMKLIADNLPKVYRGSEDLEAWEAITLGSTIGGMVIGVAGVTAAHGMEHPASGLRDIVHGKGLAALTPIIIEKSWKSDIKKYGVISRILGGIEAKDCREAVEEFLSKIDLKVKLGDLGVTMDDVEWMTENCFKVSKASIVNHTKEFSKEEVMKIYEEAI